MIEARIADQTIKLFHRGDYAADHVRDPRQRWHISIAERTRSAHHRHAELTPTRLLREVAAIRPSTIALMERILTGEPQPEKGFRAYLGILRLVGGYGPEQLQAACQRGVDIGARTYGLVQSILRNGQDRAFRPDLEPDELPVQHGNIYSSGYYH